VGLPCGYSERVSNDCLGIAHTVLLPLPIGQLQYHVHMTHQRPQEPGSLAILFRYVPIEC
jgi:hypothetical protein